MTMMTIKTVSVLTLTASLMVVFAAVGCQSPRAGTAEVPALAALPENAEKVNPLDAGERAPNVTVRGVDGRRISTSRVYRDGPTLLIFYRGGWCPFCTRHLAEIGQIEGDLRAMGYQIVGVSPDRPEKLRESLGEHDISYTLLSDSNVELARAFGVAFRVDDETNEMLRGHGIDLEDAAGRSHRVLPIPAVYLIDADGMIRFAQWDPDYRQRLSGDAVLRAAREMVGAK
ncbi:MAG: AhpC/TSA family protein [Phycisphaerales bacterium]|nr:MAG: AhpC/TSA family protein [Phycisphaerales bacterium]